MDSLKVSLLLKERKAKGQTQIILICSSVLFIRSFDPGRAMSSQSGRVDTLDGMNPNGYISSADIPEETDELVVVQALSEQLDEPIGTIVVKSVFDTYFPPKLKGIIDSDSFKVSIVQLAPC